MASYHPSRAQNARAPLGESSDHVVNASANQSYQSKSSQLLESKLEPNPLRAYSTNNRLYRASAPKPGFENGTSNIAPAPTEQQRAPKPGPENGTSNIAPTPAEQQRAPKPPAEAQAEDKRISQITTSTGEGLPKFKTHVGPWNLGKTLGRGSASRVRLARHEHSRQLAAVKILHRRNSSMAQAGSLVELDKWDRRKKTYVSENYIPLAIEREIALMKLIDHPNIVKLYDIWENRQEMYVKSSFYPPPYYNVLMLTLL